MCLCRSVNLWLIASIIKHAYVISSVRLFLWSFHGSDIFSSTFESSVSACFVVLLFILLTVST